MGGTGAGVVAGGDENFVFNEGAADGWVGGGEAEAAFGGFEGGAHPARVVGFGVGHGRCG